MTEEAKKKGNMCCGQAMYHNIGSNFDNGSFERYICLKCGYYTLEEDGYADEDTLESYREYVEENKTWTKK